MAQCPCGCLSRHTGRLASSVRRVCRRRRGQRALPCAHGRRPSAHIGASRDQRVDVHHTRELEPRAGDRRCALRDRSHLLGVDAERLAKPRRAPYLPSFDFAWFLRHRIVAEVTLLVLAFGAIALAVWIRANVAEFRQRVRQAFTVVRTPVRWLRTVVAWQLAEWALRLATVWFMLGAFRIEQSARNVLLVQAAESLATLLPISPGGVGTHRRSSSTPSAVARRGRRSWPSASA